MSQVEGGVFESYSKTLEKDTVKINVHTDQLYAITEDVEAEGDNKHVRVMEEKVNKKFQIFH